MNRKKDSKVICRSVFHKIADICREMTHSIMNDVEMIKQYNNLAILDRAQILHEVKSVNTSGKSGIGEGDLELSIVDMHIISGNNNVDPAVVFLIGILDKDIKCKLIVN